MTTAERKAKVVIEGEDRFSRTFAAFDRSVKGTDRVLTGLQGRVSSLGLSLGALGAGLSVGAILASVKAAADGFDRLNDAADVTGEKIEVLSGLEDLARRNGASLDLVEDALLKVNKALSDTDPDSDVGRALSAIGLSAAELRRQSPAEALKTLAVALAGYANDAEKARIVQVLFSRSVKEVAPFLNDLAEAGKLNGSVTEEQAKQAETFNKRLTELKTNVENVSRAISGPMISAFNKLFERFKDNGVKGVLGLSSIEEELVALRKLQGKAVLAAAEVKLAEGNALKLLANPDGYKEDLATRKAEYAQALKTAEEARIAFLRLSDGAAGGGRGFVNPDLVQPRAVIADAEKKKATGPSEAERYLEQLQRQGDQLRNLTEYEKALAEIQSGRLTGVTDKLREKILLQARDNDAERAATDRMEAQSRAAQASLASLNEMLKQNAELEKEVRGIGLTEAALADLEIARINDAIATREQTIAKREAEGVDERQLQVLNAEIDALRRRKGLLVDKVGRNAEEEVRKTLDDVADKTAETQAESIANGILEGYRRGSSFTDIWLRELKAQFAKTILTPTITPIVKAGNKLIEQILGGVLGMLNGGSFTFDPSGTGITSGNIGLADLGLGGGRANGGRVRAGRAYMVGENGPEPFIPDADGTILSNSQAKRAAGAAGQAPVVINQHWTVNGDVSPQTIAAMRAAINQNNQQLLRSMRTGGAFAGA